MFDLHIQGFILTRSMTSVSSMRVCVCVLSHFSHVQLFQPHGL